MLSAEELAALRSQMSDDEIIAGVRKHVPHFTGDIDALQGEGVPNGFILDGLVKHATSLAKPETPQEGQGQPTPTPPQPATDDRPWYAKMARALQYGAANGITGFGRTAYHLGAENYGRAVEHAGKGLAPEGYQPAGAQFSALDPSTYGHAPLAVVEGLPGLAIDTTGMMIGRAAGPVGAVAGFVGTNAARNFGPNLDARMESTLR